MFLLGAVANARRLPVEDVEPQEGANRVLLVASNTASISSSDSVVTFEGSGGANVISGDEFARALTIERAATIRNAAIIVSQNSRPRTGLIQLRVNGRGTSISFDIPVGFTGTLTSPNTVRVRAGDRITWQATAPGPGSGSFTISYGPFSFELDTDEALTTYFSANHDNVPNLSAHAGPYYQALHIPGRGTIQGWETTLSNAGFTRLQSAGKLSRARFYIRTNTLTLPTTVVLLKNDVETALSFVIPAGATGEFSNLVDEVDVAEGDVLRWKRTTPGAINTSFGALRLGRLQVMFTGTEGKTDLMSHAQEQGGPSNTPNVANYSPFGAALSVGTDESKRQIRLPYPAELSRFRLDGYYNSLGASAPFSIALRVNGSDAGPVVAIPKSSSQTALVLDTSTITTNAGDRFNIGYTAADSNSGPYAFGVCIAPKAAVPPVTTPLPAGTSSYGYTGAAQSFVVPANVSQLDVKLWGAGGGGSWVCGGTGGFTQGYIDVVQGDIVTFEVGQGGTSIGYGSTTSPSAYPDGGPAVGALNSLRGAGGGSTRILVNGRVQLVAAGGGGSAGNSTFYSGGGLTALSYTTPIDEFTGFANYKGGPGTGEPGVSGGGGAGGGGGYVGGLGTTNSFSATGGISYLGGGRVAVASTQGGPSGFQFTSPLPPQNTDPAYQAGVGIGGQGDSTGSATTPSGSGGPGLVSVSTVAPGARVLGAARVFQSHVETISTRFSSSRLYAVETLPVYQAPSKVRAYQQHVEVVRTVT